jgi:hypothetical protein
MSDTSKRITKLFLASILTAALMLVALPINAQEGNGSSGSGLRVSPTRSELSLIPGDSREILQTVRNVTQNAVTVEPVLNDFESDGVTGEPLLIGDPNNVSAYSLREFIDVPEPFDLESGEEREVTISVSVPESASPGAYFGTVLYRATPQGSQGDGQVALIASVGSLVLLEVPGDITEKIQINDISAYLGETAGSLFTKKPEKVGVEIENLGNSFSQPFGKVAVKDWRGNDVFLYELNDTTPRGNILPSSTRLFLNELFNVEVKTVNGVEEIEKTSPIKWPGRYTIVGNISHGSTGEIFTVESSFWFIPVWMIVVIAALVVGLIFGAVFMYRKYISKSTKRRK